MAFLGYIFLITFPDNQKSRSIRFLSAEERQLIIARVNQDRGDADLEKFTFKNWLGGAADWKIWLYGLCKHSSLVCAPSFHLNISGTRTPLLYHEMAAKLR